MPLQITLILFSFLEGQMKKQKHAQLRHYVQRNVCQGGGHSESLGCSSNSRLQLRPLRPPPPPSASLHLHFVWEGSAATTS